VLCICHVDSKDLWSLTNECLNPGNPSSFGPQYVLTHIMNSNITTHYTDRQTDRQTLWTYQDYQFYPIISLLWHRPHPRYERSHPLVDCSVYWKEIPVCSDHMIHLQHVNTSLTENVLDDCIANEMSPTPPLLWLLTIISITGCRLPTGITWHHMMTSVNIL